MLNSCELVGKITKMPEVIPEGNHENYADIYLAVRRPFPNRNNVYEDDIMKVTLWRGLAEECSQVCTEGSIVAVRGRLQSERRTIGKTPLLVISVIAEKMSFLHFEPKQK